MNCATAKLDSVRTKLKLIPIPKGLVPDNTYREDTCPKNGTPDCFTVKKVLVERNTGERAVVRVRMPVKRVEEEEVYVHPVTLKEEKRVVEREVEIEIDDKILIVPARVDAAPFSIFVINQSVGKW